MADMLKVAYIGMVFGHKDLFANATRALINNSASFITADGLPMPHTILGKHLTARVRERLWLSS
ncbi:hypothetical protein BJY04DRAFT_196755 [Aspergillus karnatakaensis]|uniref:uncharacterized protein n=1 Tax=Aspergillus karnatakaensis TaxID=1810916 RepID=UPI003CCDDB5A